MFCTSFSFLTKHANSKQNDSCAECFDANLTKKRAAHGVSHKHQLSNNTGQFEGKRQLRSVIWGQFRATGKLCTAFFRGFGFLTMRANLKQNDSCAEGFLTPISSRRTVAHSVLDKSYLFNKRHQFRLTRQLRMQFLTGFSFLTIRANLKQNDSCAVGLGNNFEQQHGCARCFRQVLPF